MRRRLANYGRWAATRRKATSLRSRLTPPKWVRSCARRACRGTVSRQKHEGSGHRKCHRLRVCRDPLVLSWRARSDLNPRPEVRERLRGFRVLKWTSAPGDGGGRQVKAV